MKNITINIIIIEQNINNIISLINSIDCNKNVKFFIANTKEDVIKIIEKYNIDLILCNKAFMGMSGLKDIPIFDITQIDEIEKTLSILNKKVEVGYLKENVMNQLLNLGFNFKLKGTQYLFEAIINIYKAEKFNYVDNLEKNVYSILAKEHNKTIDNIKTNITKTTNKTFVNNRKKILKETPFTDKTFTPKSIISYILNKELK